MNGYLYIYLVGDGLGNESLAASGGAVEQDPLGGREAVARVLGCVLKRVLECLRHLTLDLEMRTRSDCG